MADDWDPFADPAEEAEAAGESPSATEPPNQRKDTCAGYTFSDKPDDALLQPWELEASGHGSTQKSEALDLRHELAILSAPLSAADIPAYLGPLRPAPKLTKEQAVAMEDMLIAVYRTDEFQKNLHAAWSIAGADPQLRGKARQEVCLPVQVPIIVLFGFEASRRGVTQSVNAFTPFNGEPEIAERNTLLAWLVNPDVQQGILSAPRSRLTPTEELIDKALVGDVAAVVFLLQQRADPNTIVLRVERLKNSDSCCACTITSEEYTPLTAACMFQHAAVAEVLLEHPAVDVNLVCLGINQEMGPYKSFTVLDIARRFMKGSPLIERMELMGAKIAEELVEPPWPRPESEGTLEPPPKPVPPAVPTTPPQISATLPAVERSGGGSVEEVTTTLVDLMREHRGDPPADRLRLFRQLLLEWHPDKRPEDERELSTAVCQWLVGPAKCFVNSV